LIVGSERLGVRFFFLLGAAIVVVASHMIVDTARLPGGACAAGVEVTSTAGGVLRVSVLGAGGSRVIATVIYIGV
jgi:hypothetical protein